MNDADTYAAAYAAAVTAEDTWQAELVRVYKKRAGDARFSRLGKATPELARLSAARDAAVEAWQAAARALASR